MGDPLEMDDEMAMELLAEMDEDFDKLGPEDVNEDDDSEDFGRADSDDDDAEGREEDDDDLSDDDDGDESDLD